MHGIFKLSSRKAFRPERLLGVALAAGIATFLPGASHAQTDEGMWSQLGPNIAPASEGERTMVMSDDGSIVAVGIPSSAIVRVFTFSNGDWSQVGADIGGQLETSGSSMAMSSDGYTISVGAPGSADGKGVVRTYRYDGASWVRRGGDLVGDLGSTNTSSGDGFGSSVASSDDGNVIVVGAPGVAGDSADSGQASVFGFDGADWIRIGTDIDEEGSDSDQGDLAGTGVAMSADGNTIAVGSPGFGPDDNPSAGQVRIFSFDGTDWAQRGSGIEGQSAIDMTGEVLALSSDGSIVAIGSVNANSGGRSHGHMRVFSFDGSDWSRLGQNLDGPVGSAFGRSSAMSADGYSIAVGSLYVSLNDRERRGFINVYDYVGTRWEQRGQRIDGQQANDSFSGSIAMSSDGNALASTGSAGLGRVFGFDTSPLACNGLTATITGSGTIRGTSGNDVIVGSPGDDTIFGLAGDDIICGMGGNDRIFASAGGDTLIGGLGRDRMVGGSGDDLLVAGEGDDVFIGGSGKDSVTYKSVGSGVRVTFNGEADDGIAGEEDNVHWTVENIIGSEFNDYILGSNLKNVIRGLGGNDIIRGEGGFDTLYGGPGDDVVRGGRGKDLVNGGGGTDTCVGGANPDRFISCETATQ